LGREVRGTQPGVQSRNGMPEGGGYVYRGTGEDTGVTAGLSRARLRFEAARAVPEVPPVLKPARRRAVTRPPASSPEPAPVPASVAVPAKRCRKCTYPVGSVGHKTACGGGR
jgi:hypothetical protein